MQNLTAVVVSAARQSDLKILGIALFSGGSRRVAWCILPKTTTAISLEVVSLFQTSPFKKMTFHKLWRFFQQLLLNKQKVLIKGGSRGDDWGDRPLKPNKVPF